MALLLLVLGLTLWASRGPASTLRAPRFDAALNSLSSAQPLFRHCGIRLYVRDTQQGSGLYVHFNSGRTKRISTSFELAALESIAIASNTASRFVSAVVGK
jgi:hypothetical protein